jgi:hypothetical protein
MTIQLYIAHMRTDLAGIRTDLLRDLQNDSFLARDEQRNPVEDSRVPKLESSPSSVADAVGIAFKPSQVVARDELPLLVNVPV